MSFWRLKHYNNKPALDVRNQYNKFRHLNNLNQGSVRKKSQRKNIILLEANFMDNLIKFEKNTLFSVISRIIFTA
jgi:hypothetical protein